MIINRNGKDWVYDPESGFLMNHKCYMNGCNCCNCNEASECDVDEVLDMLNEEESHR